ncbi:MAG: DUF1592 domain-containing protein, partial [Planctomycetota bacterium]
MLDEKQKNLVYGRWPLVCSSAVAAAFVLACGAEAAEGISPPSSTLGFIENHCVDCHSGDHAEAGLDLSSYSSRGDTVDVTQWARIFDRVDSREMPPPDMSYATEDEIDGFVRQTGAWLHHYQRSEFDELGRVRGRRLTNLQLERTLHDVLGVDVPLATLMPEDPRVAGFATVADGQPMSHFQLRQHLEVVDVALDEAFRRAATGPDEREWFFDAKTLARETPDSGFREPELIDGHAVSWSCSLAFYGRMPKTQPAEDGRYRITVRAKALNRPASHGVWCTVRSGVCSAGAPMMAWIGSFEAHDEPQEWTFEAWVPKEHMIEVRAGDVTLKKARMPGGQVPPGVGGPQNVPGIAVEWMKIERLHNGPSDEEVRRILFGELAATGKSRDGAWSVSTNKPFRDAERLMLRFARRAFRRPTSASDIRPYTTLVHDLLAESMPFPDALRAGYRALLCSPRFLYFQEPAGLLDDYAIASRLSYFLWNSPPDRRLLALAASGRLSDPAVLSRQVDRMLDEERDERFVADFASEWLELRLIGFTEPDGRLYPGFDALVQQAMLDETHAFLAKMLRDDLSVSHL